MLHSRPPLSFGKKTAKMNYEVSVDGTANTDVLTWLNGLVGKLEQSEPRWFAHLGSDGVAFVVCPTSSGVALTAMWRHRGDAHALTIAGDDEWHVFCELEQSLCQIFKVPEESQWIEYP